VLAISHSKTPKKHAKSLDFVFRFLKKKLGSNHTRKSCDGAKRVQLLRKRNIHDTQSVGSRETLKVRNWFKRASVEIFALRAQKNPEGSIDHFPKCAERRGTRVM
jgi:hypothetical protein